MQLSDLVYIDGTGCHYADYPSFLSWLQDQYRAIYGADVYLAADSQDGQFIGVLAKAFYDTAALGGSVCNSFSPLSAQGTGLSRLVKINGLKRQVPTYSTAVLTIFGVAGTVIENGVATDGLDQKWLLPPLVTIPGDGDIDVVATAEEVGAIAASADQIDTIFTPTLGWQEVNNNNPATPGAAVESDATLRIRQSRSVADPSLTVLEGTSGAVGNVSGVTKVRPYENDTAITDAIGLPAHSVCIVVAGGDDTAIAQEIQLHKTPGAETFGDTTVLVYDSHGMPLNIKFQRVVVATIGVQISLTALPGWSNDYLDLIAQAVADYINTGAAAITPTPGANGLGDDISYIKLIIPAYLQGTPAAGTFTITLVEVQKNGGGFSAANIDLEFDEDPVCDPVADVLIIVS